MLYSGVRNLSVKKVCHFGGNFIRNSPVLLSVYIAACLNKLKAERQPLIAFGIVFLKHSNGNNLLLLFSFCEKEQPKFQFVGQLSVLGNCLFSHFEEKFLFWAFINTKGKREVADALVRNEKTCQAAQKKVSSRKIPEKSRICHAYIDDAGGPLPEGPCLLAARRCPPPGGAQRLPVLYSHTCAPHILGGRVAVTALVPPADRDAEILSENLT